MEIEERGLEKKKVNLILLPKYTWCIVLFSIKIKNNNWFRVNKDHEKLIWVMRSYLEMKKMIFIFKKTVLILLERLIIN